jgi:hypothetical protein
MAASSNEVFRDLGPDIQWRESYVTDDKIYCVYLAKDADIIREHAKKAGIPADKISEIKAVLDPTSEARSNDFKRESDSPFKEIRMY